ncbi:1-phosphatidylinositol-3-phosphate 5-kinase FAB1B-like isoform X1 [Coffea arabica]|uniref:1-phosphatidylinositol-3-phosphate 5-kinase n=1 Tax=Coffea arabica TaxID=13443 RepID=A0ABM4UVI1_COFAR
MGSPDNNKLSEIVDRVRSWIPRRMEPTNVSRDFWMPDQSCRVCYECDSQFTVFNRRHHCRLCGRVFCAKCAANSIPAPSDESRTGWEDREKIRVCNYCFKHWERGMTTADNGMTTSSPVLSPSPSSTSLISSYSSCTCNSGCSIGSTPYSMGPFQHVTYSSDQSPHQANQMDEVNARHYGPSCPGKSDSNNISDHLSDEFGSCNSARNGGEDYDYSVYRLHSQPSHLSSGEVYYSSGSCGDINNDYGVDNVQPNGEKNEASMSSTMMPENTETHISQIKEMLDKEAEGLNNGCIDQVPSPSNINGTAAEPLDFENNSLLWLPPEPEDKEDEQDALPFDDDEDARDDAAGEWGYLRSSGSFGSGEHRNRERSIEEHKKAMKYVLDGHFRGLIAQLLQIENLPVNVEDSKDSWLDIITSLSWEAATLLKPDTSTSGCMDPGGYVKVKCIACGHRRESMVVKGVVCKKNVAHRRMTSKVDKPRLLILGGALEYQRVANHLSSFDTLLQQEMDHLKMAVAKIDAHHPNVLLVEKSVSRFAQEYLLAKDISLVLNIKRSLLERIARCTGAQIVPSVDHLATQKLGYCDSFHVEKFLEVHGSAGQGGKKLTKTLMFFEGCPKPLGFTVLLKGANGDELKKVKHVMQYGVFAAYHLALETSFLADEGASLPEFPLKSPVKVALPDKPSGIDRSISTIREFTVAHDNFDSKQPYQSSCNIFSHNTSSNGCLLPEEKSSLSEGSNSIRSAQNHVNSLSSSHCLRDTVSDCHREEFCGYPASNEREKVQLSLEASSVCKPSEICTRKVQEDSLNSSCSCNSEAVGKGHCYLHSVEHCLPSNSSIFDHLNEVAFLKGEFSSSASDNQSILVSLMTRCVWKRSVCERAHLFRIKYYGTFDKPLGRFLRDNLFDQNYRCHSCQMPSEAHIHCYSHQQGSLTISVRKLPEFFLPGEQAGKIWMWHRCLRCPRINGFPPATKRIVMSDAAWGLSFGKFLELSFSNHAAASRVASCGHSLHRDCLRFYGFGRMAACFQYAPINVHSVYLPPPKLEFNYDFQEWIQKEADEVCSRAELLFAEVVKSLHQITENIRLDNGNKAPRVMERKSELEGVLQKEKKEFEELLDEVLYRKVKAGQPAVDILAVNRLRKQLIIHSYIWDQRLIQMNNLNDNNLRGGSSSTPKMKGKTVSSGSNTSEMAVTSKPSKGFSSCDSFLLNLKPDVTFIQGGYDNFYSPDGDHNRNDMDEGSYCQKDNEVNQPSGTNSNDEFGPESLKTVRRVHSDGQIPIVENLSDTLDAAWTGDSHSLGTTSKGNGSSISDFCLTDASSLNGTKANQDIEISGTVQGGVEYQDSFFSLSSTKGPENRENSRSWITMPFLNLYNSFLKSSTANEDKLDKISTYNPAYISSFRDLLHQGGARVLLPVGINDTVLPVYDDEPTSIIAYVLVSPDYHNQMLTEPTKDGLHSPPSFPFLESANLLLLPSLDEAASGSLRSLGSTDESVLSVSGSRGSSTLDPVVYTNALHARVSFSDDGPLGKVKYSVTCYYAKQFEALRRSCCPSELDFIRSLSRCRKWGAQGGKSNVFFAKTLDDRFIIKQVTKTELESFITFGRAYFKYLSESLSTGSPTCLAKILGIYQVTSKHLKGGKESKMDVLVMENLLFGRNIVRLYDLKGSSRSRYNPDSSGSNKVLLDQNLIEAMPTSPIFVGPKAKRLLERAVWNDTAFLASIDVMDYSLLVGMDEEKHELVVGIIDFMRQYTWDKHLETWVKASGILGGPKNATPTVISPGEYKKRFRKAMCAYFLMVPDQWSSSTVTASRSESELCEESLQGGVLLS